MNDSGTIVGTVELFAGDYAGFLISSTATPEPSSFVISALGIAIVASLRRALSRRNRGRLLLGRNSNLNSAVEYACQALSIDDQRRTFAPVLWADDPRIEQVWFAGAHSNVGGGYPKQGMSLVTLDWMLQKAHDRSGLRLLTSDRLFCREHANVDDKLYAPRSVFDNSRSLLVGSVGPPARLKKDSRLAT
jgi:Uncharacterized alpha/beta hydrolase domain (DUF2235)